MHHYLSTQIDAQANQVTWQFWQLSGLIRTFLMASQWLMTRPKRLTHWKTSGSPVQRSRLAVATRQISIPGSGQFTETQIGSLDPSTGPSI